MESCPRPLSESLGLPDVFPHLPVSGSTRSAAAAVLHVRCFSLFKNSTTGARVEVCTCDVKE